MRHGVRSSGTFSASWNLWIMVTIAVVLVFFGAWAIFSPSNSAAVEALAEEEVEDVVGESEQRLEADVKVAEAIQRAKNRAKAKDVAVEAEASSGLAEETGAEGAGEEDEQGVEVAGGEEGGIDSKLDFSSSSLFQPFPPSYRNLFLYSPAQFFFADLAAVEAAWDSEDAAAADPNVPAADLRTESSSSEFPPSSFLSLSLIPTSPSLSLLQFFSADLAAVEAAWDSEDAAAADPNVPAADLRTESTSSEAGSGLESQARESEEEARLDIREAATKKQESKKTEDDFGEVEGGATIIQSSPESKEPPLMAGPVGQGTGEEGGGALPSLDLENAKFRWPSCGGNLMDDFGEVEGGATIIQNSPESKEPPLMAGPVGQGTGEEGGGALPSLDLENAKFRWPSCGGNRTDWVPCLDNEKAIKALRTNKHYEHRERHCPLPGEMEKCLVPLPKGYKAHVPWPESRDQVWYDNVPHPGLASYKKDQNWVAMEGDKLVFPGGGTQFTHGATGYINFVQKAFADVAWGRRVRVMLDMGCGVASLSAYLDAFDVRVMSMAPKDEHEAQIQLALERGVLAVVGVMGTQRLPFSSNSFDAVHCARCRVPWHIDGGWGIIPNQACVHALPLSLCLPFSSNSLMLFTALDAVCHGTLMVGGGSFPIKHVCMRSLSHCAFPSPPTP
ncbi:unnamed protein product [Closterium sp. NIES-65]|nr:unnamed protein product [Closterium sp. NIES-65]